jgi:hypothetical protein
MKCEYTSDEIASFASIGLKQGKAALTDEQFRAVCGSALTQARPHGPLGLANAFLTGPVLPPRNMLAEFLRRG